MIFLVIPAARLQKRGAMEHLVSTVLFWPILWLMAGLAILLLGGHLLVPATVSLARHLRLPPQLIALLLVAGGTSAPELLVSAEAALSGSPAIAISNVAGSNMANMLLVLGLGAVLAPIATHEAVSRRDMLVMAGFTTLVFGFFMLTGSLPAFGAGLLLVLFVLYIGWVLKSDSGIEAEPDSPLRPAQSAALLLVAVVSLIIGADLMVDGAVDLARQAGISEAVIGMSIVAIGTSLPELAAVLASLLHRQSDLALANVIGSNIFNLAGVLGIAGLLAPLPAGPELTEFGLPAVAAITLLLGGYVLTGKPIGRKSGLVFIGLYLMFLFWTYVG
jgi:cation:H+ antiporter